MTFSFLKYAAVSLALASPALADDCGPCKIVGTLTNVKGEIVEQFKYPIPFDTLAECEAELTSENFKLALADLQSKARDLGMLGPDFRDITATAKCVP